MSASIVVATDFSTRSDRALRRATLLARQLDATLALVHVVDDDQPAYLVDAQLDTSRSLLDKTAHTITTLDGVAAQANVLSGDVFSGILQVAEVANAALIVVGQHRRQLRDVFVGTTAERTIAHSSRPVLLAAGLPSAPYDRTVIALDLDDVSASMAQSVQGLGIVDQSVITAMHAFDAPAHGMMKRGMIDPEAIDHYLSGEERRANDQFAAFLSEAGLPAARQVLVPINGTPARTILECARAEDADLVVVGTSQKTGIKRFLLGSVAEDVLGDAECVVLVVPGR
jgi:nucleotide-binding universal stress UspA family protein